jgi:hypothetical protein
VACGGAQVEYLASQRRLNSGCSDCGLTCFSLAPAPGVNAGGRSLYDRFVTPESRVVGAQAFTLAPKANS